MQTKLQLIVILLALMMVCWLIVDCLRLVAWLNEIVSVYVLQILIADQIE